MIGSINNNNGGRISSIGSTRLFADGLVVSLGAFGATAVWFVRTVVRQQIPETQFHKRRRKSMQDLQQQTPAITNKGSNGVAFGEVSARGKTALIPAIPYQRQFFTCFEVRTGWTIDWI